MEDRTCKKCGHVFEKPFYLKRHLQRKKPCSTASEETQKTHTCDHCGHGFSEASLLAQHMISCDKLSKMTEEIEDLRSKLALLTKPSEDIQEPGRAAAVHLSSKTIITTTVTETRSLDIAFLPWDGPEPSCIVITTEQIIQAFKENPVLQEYASLHHDQMVDPKTAPDYIVELFMDLIKRGHEAPEARNIHLNPNRSDQVRIHMRSGSWEVHELSSVSRTLLESVARVIKQMALRENALSMYTKEALVWANLHYGAEPTKYAKAMQKPLAAHLMNMIPRGNQALS